MISLEALPVSIRANTVNAVGCGRKGRRLKVKGYKPRHRRAEIARKNEAVLPEQREYNCAKEGVDGEGVGGEKAE
jgi:hypothetical protein